MGAQSARSTDLCGGRPKGQDPQRGRGNRRPTDRRKEQTVTNNKFFKRLRGKVYLTSEALALPLPELRKALAEAGYKVSRPTLWRARKLGWFVPNFFQKGGLKRSSTHGFVRLSEAEKQQEATILAKRFGITYTTASKAKERGWFEVTTTNLDSLTSLAKERIRSTPENGETP